MEILRITARTAMVALDINFTMVVTVSRAQAEITIAAVGPMKGPFDAFGEQMKRGAAQAVADINGKGVCFKPIMGVWDMLCDDDPRKGPIAFRFKDQTVHGASLDIECDDLI